jgi:hypothetical protein
MDAAIRVQCACISNPEYESALLQRNENSSPKGTRSNISSAEVIHAITENVVITLLNGCDNEIKTFLQFRQRILQFPQSSSGSM